jgi:hypothetical protein
MKKIDNGSELVVYDENNNNVNLKLRLNELSMYFSSYYDKYIKISFKII